VEVSGRRGLAEKAFFLGLGRLMGSK